jgi:hypothetical protein
MVEYKAFIFIDKSFKKADGTCSAYLKVSRQCKKTDTNRQFAT